MGTLDQSNPTAMGVQPASTLGLVPPTQTPATLVPSPATAVTVQSTVVPPNTPNVAPPIVPAPTGTTVQTAGPPGFLTPQGNPPGGAPTQQPTPAPTLDTGLTPAVAPAGSNMNQKNPLTNT